MMAPERYRQWLDTLQRPPRMHVHQDRAAFARRLLHTDRFLTAERARNSCPNTSPASATAKTKAGQRRHGIIWNGDPWHKAPAPYLFRLEESMAIWRQITCPVLWVAGRDSWIIRDFATRPGDWEARQACLPTCAWEWIENTTTCCTMTSRLRWRGSSKRHSLRKRS